MRYTITTTTGTFETRTLGQAVDLVAILGATLNDIREIGS